MFLLVDELWESVSVFNLFLLFCEIFFMYFKDVFSVVLFVEFFVWCFKVVFFWGVVSSGEFILVCELVILCKYLVELGECKNLLEGRGGVMEEGNVYSWFCCNCNIGEVVEVMVVRLWL